MREVESRAVKALPGDLPACNRCGQRPDSITFNAVDCRPDCPINNTALLRVSSKQRLAMASHLNR